MLVGLHAQVERVVASRMVVSRQPGFERVLSGDGSDDRDVRDTVQGEALVLFASGSPGAGDPSRLLDALRDPAAELLSDESFAPGDPPPHVLARDPRLPVVVSHAWFGGEEHVGGPTCAC